MFIVSVWSLSSNEPTVCARSVEDPANTRRCPNHVVMLSQRRRRWTNIEAQLFKIACSLGAGVVDIMQKK